MKKIAFTLCAIGLIVSLPLIAVLQLNHGLNTSPYFEKLSIPANENVSSHAIVTLPILFIEII